MTVRTEKWFGKISRVAVLPIEVGDVIGWMVKHSDYTRLGTVTEVHPPVDEKSRYYKVVSVPWRLHTHKQTIVRGTQPDFYMRTLLPSDWPFGPWETAFGPVIGIEYAHTYLNMIHNKMFGHYAANLLGISHGDVVHEYTDKHPRFKEAFRQTPPGHGRKTLREIINAVSFDSPAPEKGTS